MTKALIATSKKSHPANSIVCESQTDSFGRHEFNDLKVSKLNVLMSSFDGLISEMNAM